jgi:hypothetical protein
MLNPVVALPIPTAETSAPLTVALIESAINGLPLQARVLMRILLIQYFDITQEDIDYMAADRPDPRRQSGTKAENPVVTIETLTGIANRTSEYMLHLRKRRERAWLQVEYLRKQTVTDRLRAKLATQLLGTRFQMSQDDLQALTDSARSTVYRPALRELERQWLADEIDANAYQTRRLAIEYQIMLRRLERDEKRFGAVQRTFETRNLALLQDHEICHTWGIPAGSLSGRKVKHIQHFLQVLQGLLKKVDPTVSADRDLWKETFATLANKPVERSIAVFDPADGDEGEMLDKLTAMSLGRMPEDQEAKLWQIISRDQKPNQEQGLLQQSLFGLQRLCAIQADRDTSPDALEAEMLEFTAPIQKAPVAELPDQTDTPAETISGDAMRRMLGEA